MTDKVSRTVDHDLATVPIGKHFKITPDGLEILGKPSFEQFSEMGEILRTFDRALQFAIGDWINALEDRFGEKASQVVDASGWSESTVKVYSWTASRVPKVNRMIDRGLSYAHHQVIGALPPAEQRQWLTMALGSKDDDGPWTVGRLKAAVRDGSDLGPTSWYIVVSCKDEQDQAALVKRLELDGRTVRALEKHGRRIAGA